MRIGPLFKWFGSKWSSGRLYPAPEYPVIVEPFAGGAGYSLNHSERRVILCESDAHIYDLWAWLILDATEAQIKEIPIGVPEGSDIREIGLTAGQALLLKSWQRTNNVGNCWTISPWGNKPGQWTANTRARVAEQVSAVKHWILAGRDAFEALDGSIEATWFIDPPYQFNYQYRGGRVDYARLAAAVQAQRGQKIVCEAAHPKTGETPAWLPFVPFARRVTSRRKAENSHHSSELVWCA